MKYTSLTCVLLYIKIAITWCCLSFYVESCTCGRSRKNADAFGYSYFNCFRSITFHPNTLCLTQPNTAVFLQKFCGNRNISRPAFISQKAGKAPSHIGIALLVSKTSTCPTLFKCYNRWQDLVYGSSQTTKFPQNNNNDHYHNRNYPLQMLLHGQHSFAPINKGHFNHVGNFEVNPTKIAAPSCDNLRPTSKLGQKPLRQRPALNPVVCRIYDNQEKLSSKFSKEDER